MSDIHISYYYSITTPDDVSYNLDPDNLELFCDFCHLFSYCNECSEYYDGPCHPDDFSYHFDELCFFRDLVKNCFKVYYIKSTSWAVDSDLPFDFACDNTILFDYNEYFKGDLL